MAKPTASLESIKDFWNSQINEEANWALNMAHEFGSVTLYMNKIGLRLTNTDQIKLLRALGFFGGSIFIMRNFGDLMAI